MPTELRCPKGHRFTTNARPGNTTGCPACRQETGRRTSVRVPVASVAARSGRQHQGAAPDVGETRRLASAWAAEEPAAYDWHEMPMQPSDYECDNCKGTLTWHSAHAALACLECDTVHAQPSLGVKDRAEAHAAALARKRAGISREVAKPDPEADARARAERLDLHRNREMVRQYAGKALAWCKLSFERPQVERLARQIGATLRGYLPEIEQAPDNPTLTAIFRELQAIRQGREFTTLVEEWNRQRDEVQHYAERLRERADRADRRASEAEEARRLALAEDHRAATARQLEVQLPRALPPAAPPAPRQPTSLARAIRTRRQRGQLKARLLEQNGACQFCRKPTPATRVYALNQQAPRTLSCPKHYKDADQWVSQLYGGGKYYYWELGTA